MKSSIWSFYFCKLLKLECHSFNVYDTKAICYHTKSKLKIIIATKTENFPILHNTWIRLSKTCYIFYLWKLFPFLLNHIVHTSGSFFSSSYKKYLLFYCYRYRIIVDIGLPAMKIFLIDFII